MILRTTGRSLCAHLIMTAASLTFVTSAPAEVRLGGVWGGIFVESQYTFGLTAPGPRSPGFDERFCKATRNYGLQIRLGTMLHFARVSETK